MRIRRVVAAAVAAVAVASCGGTPPREVGGVGDGTGEVTLWYHGTGPERVALEDQVGRFNALGTGVTVRIVSLPPGDYLRQVEITGTADRLPDLFDLDGTALPALARDGSIVPLDGLVNPAAVSDLVPAVSRRGIVGGRRYGVGTTETTVALFGNRRLLAAAGLTPPRRPEDAWTAAEFTAALDRLAARDSDGKVLDLRLPEGTATYGRQPTNWWAYGIGPVIWSAGGDFLDGDRTAASGTLDSPAVTAAMAEVAGWRDKVVWDPDDLAFRERRVALSWASTRSWPAYARSLGRDLAVLPLPDFGAGTKTSSGGWTWAVSTRSPRQKAAARFLDFLLRPAEVGTTAGAAGAAPGTRTALAADRWYRPGGAMGLPAAMLANACGPGAISRACAAVPLPVTAGWDTVRVEAGRALRAALGGLENAVPADPAVSLGTAATAIDADFAAHGGYRQP